MNIVPILSKDKDSLVSVVEALLERCKSGETISVTFVEFKPNNMYSIGGSNVGSRLETAGALLEAAVKRLQSPNVE